jgi:hypothetical protein
MFRKTTRDCRAAMLFVVVLAVVLGSVPADLAAEEPSNGYYRVETITFDDGTQLDRVTINGPPTPPAGRDVAAVASVPNESTAYANPLLVPAYDWVFGCSAVSASMIAAYFDREALSSIYTGTTNDGVMPMDNSVWGTWSDGHDTYPANPLTASRDGLDGRATRGSIDDYWIEYGNGDDDPYIVNGWTEHAWGDAVGDYMKTSQSAYDNVDGATSFYRWTSSPDPLTCETMVDVYGMEDDGTVGRKEFYEARGYEVGDCYNQRTDNDDGGFTFADYKAKIDAGYPVFLNMSSPRAGHSVVGIGYAEPSTVYLNDTWDYDTHSMDWSGTYSRYRLEITAVSIAEPVYPTAVELARFEAWPEQTGIHVLWETALEVDTLGFNVYRATAQEGVRTKLNAELIQSLLPPGSALGAVYDYIDTTVEENTGYFYWLEDVDVYGRGYLHGPVEAQASSTMRGVRVYLPLLAGAVGLP